MKRRILIIGIALLAHVMETSAAEVMPQAASRSDDVKELEESYGAPSQKAFGSAVLTDHAKDRAELETAARAAYRSFTGELWEKWGEDTWMSGWKLLWERRGAGNIVEELRKLPDNAARMNADMIIGIEPDPPKAQARLAAVFDTPDVEDLLVFALGDGDAISGLLIAARRAPDDAVLLVFLID